MPPRNGERSQFSVDDLPEGIVQGLTPEAIELAIQPHAVNCLVSNDLWLMVSEVARWESAGSGKKVSVSEIVRRAISQYANDDPELREFMENGAVEVLSFRARRSVSNS